MTTLLIILGIFAVVGLIILMAKVGKQEKDIYNEAWHRKYQNRKEGK